MVVLGDIIGYSINWFIGNVVKNGGFGIKPVWFWIQTQWFTSWVASKSSVSLAIIIHKMEILIVPILFGCCDVKIRKSN